MGSIRGQLRPGGTALLVLVLLLAATLASRIGGAEARAGSAKQQCIQELEEPPYEVTSVLLNPHETEILSKGTYRDIEGCDSWKRLAKRRVQLKQHGQWVDLEGDFWYPTYEYENKFHKFSFLSFATHGVHEEREHGHWQPARVRFINFVRSVETGKIVGHGEIKDQPVKIAGSARRSASNAAPYQAPTSALASGSEGATLAEQCASEILEQPEIEQLDMVKPGKEYQSIFIRAAYAAVDDACTGHYLRRAAIKFQLVRHGRVINLEPAWDFFSIGNEEGSTGIEWLNSHHTRAFYYRAGDKVRCLLRLQDRSVPMRKVTRTDVKTYPVRVKP